MSVIISHKKKMDRTPHPVTEIKDAIVNIYATEELSAFQFTDSTGDEFVEITFPTGMLVSILNQLHKMRCEEFVFQSADDDHSATGNMFS